MCRVHDTLTCVDFLVVLTIDEIYQRIRHGGGGQPTLPTGQFSLLKKINTQNMLYKRRSCSSVS
jgi:hypothetical protein